MKLWKAALLFLGIALVGYVILYKVEPEYAYIPPGEKILNEAAIDTDTELYHTSLGEPQNRGGAVQVNADDWGLTINEAFLSFGREAFYKETFGNEIFLTDIVGVIDGPFTIPNIMKAIMKLNGEGTANLRVELADDIKIGDKQYRKGDLIDTGIDVVRGTYTPLGMPVTFSDGRVRVGISCAVCHATVDRETKMVVEGAPNADLNAGLILALASNSSAYFTHAQLSNLNEFIKDTKRTVKTTKGTEEALPDPRLLEETVDSILMKWPPGDFDSTIDLQANPAQIPDSFTLGDHPYGWSGFGLSGPFKGLSTFSNNVHAQNSDSLSQSEISQPLFGIDKEVYIGTILQNAANSKFRYNPESKMKPSEFLASVDPTPGIIGINELVPSPVFPRVSIIAPDGLFISSPGYKIWEQINGIAAWQNTLVPPQPKRKAPSAETVALGRVVFEKAGCITCHAGNSYTNNRIVSVHEIKTDPSRARSLKKTEKIFGESYIYQFDQNVPLPDNPKVLKVPVDHLDQEQIKLAYAHGNSPGGYKTPSLIGLYWTAPYLHDGGIAVGKNAESELGIPGTLLKGIQPDPYNSLKALVDQDLRQKVLAANRSVKALEQVHVKGIGHPFWVDAAAGFTPEQQDALIEFLLSLKGK